MANMDVYVNKGKSDVQDKLKTATDEVKRMGDEFKETKDGLSGMPGGLDSDIQSMIEQAKDQGKREAEADIEGVKSSTVADAKSSADTIKSDVTQKISDNQTAKGKMGAINSKYGKSAMQCSAPMSMNMITAIDVRYDTLHLTAKWISIPQNIPPNNI